MSAEGTGVRRVGEGARFGVLSGTDGWSWERNGVPLSPELTRMSSDGAATGEG